MKLQAAAALVALVLATAGASPAPSASPATVPASAMPTTAAPASAHWTVSMVDPEGQALFDRGLLMLYAFDVGEARVAFGQLIARDPDCVMAYWGLAEADTIDINLPSTPEGEVRGAKAVAQARAHLAHATPDERALVAAISKRYAGGKIAVEFSRYAHAMSDYTKTRRDEPNALVVAGYAIFTDLGSFTDDKGAMIPFAREILADVDRALALEPTNVGAHHLRIHLLEESGRPRDAIPDAYALESYTYGPGESHLPHMAGHIWSRTGDFDRLIADNERAVENDKLWFAEGDGPGQQYMKRYHDHDVDFVAYGLTTIGRNDEACAFVAGEDAYSRIGVELRLHDYAAVMAIAPSDTSPARVPLAHAIAAGRLGDAAKAKADLKASGSGPIPSALVAAAIAQGAKDTAGELKAYALAYALTKDGNPGDPKTYWAEAIGEGYGAALLAAGKLAQAETVFTAELIRYPNDPHLEWGLAQALTAQGKDATASLAAYRAHWKGTHDLTLDQLG